MEHISKLIVVALERVPLTGAAADLERNPMGDGVKCPGCQGKGVVFHPGNGPVGFRCRVCGGRGWARQLGPGGGFVTFHSDCVDTENNLPEARARPEGLLDG